MDIAFKEITDNDLPEVKNIYDWHIANSTATFHTDPIRIDQLKEFIFINHPLYNSYLIYADDELTGYCLLTNHKNRPAYNRTAEITIYLKPEFGRKGIGRAAIAHLENTAQQKGIKNLIGVITGDNMASIALFKKAGYTKCAHYKNVGEKFGKILDVVAFQKEI